MFISSTLERLCCYYSTLLSDTAFSLAECVLSFALQKILFLLDDACADTNVTRFWKISLNVILKYIELHNLL